MSETLRETIENAFKYYQWLEAESDRGPLAVATPTTRKLADASISVNTRRAWTHGGGPPRLTTPC